MNNPTEQLAHDNYNGITIEDHKLLQYHRMMRLMNGSANLRNPLFLAFRRQDWKQYLLFDVKTYEQYEEGLQSWMKEDPQGATEFKSYQGMSG